jgi:dolichol-phosphate mannosyltransferase
MASALVALGLAVWVFCDAYSNRSAPRGWASTIVIVLFMGSVQLISLGIIGEYIRLIFLECKGRPTYVVGAYRPADDPAERPAVATPSARVIARSRQV